LILSFTANLAKIIDPQRKARQPCHLDAVCSFLP